MLKKNKRRCHYNLCDTIVVLENNILGKPKGEKDAFNMLKSLKGRPIEFILD